MPVGDAVIAFHGGKGAFKISKIQATSNHSMRVHDARPDLLSNKPAG